MGLIMTLAALIIAFFAIIGLIVVITGSSSNSDKVKIAQINSRHELEMAKMQREREERDMAHRAEMAKKEADIEAMRLALDDSSQNNGETDRVRV